MERGAARACVRLALTMRAIWVQWLKATRGWNANVLSLLGWAVLAALAQAWGEEAPTDWADVGPLLVFGLGALGTWWWHREVGLGWVHEGGVWLRRWYRRALRLRPRLGIDFRRTPPVPSGIPPGYWMGPLLALGLGLAAWAATAWAPQGLRSALVPEGYLAYLAVIALLWGFALWLTAFAVIFVFAQLHAWFELRRRLSDGARGHYEAHLHLFLALDLVLCWAFAPTAWAMGFLCAASLVCGLLWSAPQPEREAQLWRNARGELRSLSVRRRNLLVGAWPLASCAAVVWLLRGNWFGTATALSSMPVSAVLAKICAWSCAAGAGLLAVRQVVRFVRDFLTHPARRHPPVVHVSGFLSEGEQRETKRALRRQGLSARFGGEAQAHHVAVRIATDDPSAQREPAGQTSEPRWPLTIELADLHSGARRVLLFRRWQTQCRRVLLRRFQALYKGATSQAYVYGEGFWVGMQHTSFPWLMRDQWEDDETTRGQVLDGGMIGRPYRDVFPATVRQYYHQVTRDVQVDLIFVGDGVRFSGLRLVFQTLFELHDVYAGEVRAEEHHFAGIHNVRVLIQDVEAEAAPPRSLREPDYTEIGRARILLVLPNRGKDRERRTVPATGDHAPVLV